jgi:hypothetical protein
MPNFNIADSLSRALIQWFLNVRVQDSKGYGVSNVTVNVTNSSGLVYQSLTDSNGYTGWNVLSQEILTNSSIISYTPYIATAQSPDCVKIYSNTTYLTSSQVLIITLQNLLTTLYLVRLDSTPDKIVYNHNDNVSFTFNVYNPSCASVSFNLTVVTPGQTFYCNSSIPYYSYVELPCGNMTLPLYINTINVSLIPNITGWTPQYQNFTFYTSISNNVVVPDSNVLVILALAFTTFFFLRKKLEGKKPKKLK